MIATNNSQSLLLNKQSGRTEADKVKVIWTSPTLPEDPMIWRKDLDPAVKEKLRQFFITYARGDTPDAVRQRANLKPLAIGGFEAADNNHLLIVRGALARREPDDLEGRRELDDLEGRSERGCGADLDGQLAAHSGAGPGCR